MVKAVRGAISVNSNTHNSMEEAVYQLISSLINTNIIEEQDIISIIFSQTKDLDIANPAAALRKSGQFANIPLFCTSEPEYENSISSIVRVLLTFNTDSTESVNPVYLGSATELRRDLSARE
jgi:chorismate mutase